MIISHRHRFIFIKMRKTAGSSIESALAPHLGAEDIATGSVTDGTPAQNVPEGIRTGHAGWATIEKAMGVTNLVGYYRFTVERNPWDKTLSDWLYQHGREVFDGSLADYIEQGKAPAEWEKYAEGGFKVWKFEELVRSQAFGQLCHRLGLPPMTLPHLKRTVGRAHYREYYDERARKAVAELFAREIAHFGYSF